jgi:hypothetical protein
MIFSPIFYIKKVKYYVSESASACDISWILDHLLLDIEKGLSLEMVSYLILVLCESFQGNYWPVNTTSIPGMSMHAQLSSLMI